MNLKLIKRKKLILMSTCCCQKVDVIAPPLDWRYFEKFLPYHHQNQSHYNTLIIFYLYTEFKSIALVDYFSFTVIIRTVQYSICICKHMNFSDSCKERVCENSRVQILSQGWQFLIHSKYVYRRRDKGLWQYLHVALKAWNQCNLITSNLLVSVVYVVTTAQFLRGKTNLFSTYPGTPCGQHWRWWRCWPRDQAQWRRVAGRITTGWWRISIRTCCAGEVSPR